MCSPRKLLIYTPQLTNYQYDFICQLAKYFQEITVDNKTVSNICFENHNITKTKTSDFLTQFALSKKHETLLVGGYCEPIALKYILISILTKKRIFLHLERPLPEKNKTKYFLKRFIRSIVLRLPHGIIAIDKKAYKEYKRYNHCINVPYSLDFNRYTSSRKSRKSSFNVIFIGKLIDRKGVQELVKAFNQNPLLNQKEIFLHIYGEGYLKHIIKSLNKNPNVTFFNSVDWRQLPQIVSEYDLFILPSKHDGWGVTLVEAVITGIPCIATNEVGSKMFVNELLPGHVLETKVDPELITLSIYQVFTQRFLWDARTGETAFEVLQHSIVNACNAAREVNEFIST